MKIKDFRNPVSETDQMLSKAIFMDRDGVINKWEPGGTDNPESWYVLSGEDFEFIPEALEAFKLLSKTDYKLYVVSNQSGIGQGMVDWDIIDTIFWSMALTVNQEAGVKLDYRFCPHAPDAGCACRKPKPGMILAFAVDDEIDLSKSWMIGDSITDIQAGLNAGMPAEHCLEIGEGVIKKLPARAFPNLLEAAQYIINASGKAKENDICSSVSG